MRRVNAVQSLQVALLKHWDRGHRDLPWRRTRDPYRVWVSEVMLQQTQVETVIPYYRRFLRAFPTVRRLARAPLGRVLKLWEGLGYYGRARNLHAAARRVVREHGGRLPRERDALLALPGIGRYTVGAIRSIAFGAPDPVLDGNVIRILARLTACRDDPRKPASRERLWEVAAKLVPQRRPGDFNQALMELGALVCTPRTPRCDECPLRSRCRAYRLGRPEDFPVRAPRPKVPRREGVAALIVRNGRVLVVRRPVEGLLGGLWETPWVYRKRGESPPAAARRAARERAGIAVRPGAAQTPIEHAFTHFHLTLTPVACRLAGTSRVNGVPSRWIDPRRLGREALHASMHRILEALNALDLHKSDK